MSVASPPRDDELTSGSRRDFYETTAGASQLRSPRLEPGTVAS